MDGKRAVREPMIRKAQLPQSRAQSQAKWQKETLHASAGRHLGTLIESGVRGSARLFELPKFWLIVSHLELVLD